MESSGIEWNLELRSRSGEPEALAALKSRSPDRKSWLLLMEMSEIVSSRVEKDFIKEASPSLDDRNSASVEGI